MQKTHVIVAAIRDVPFLGSIIVVCFRDAREQDRFHGVQGLLSSMDSRQLEELEHPYKEMHDIVRNLETKELIKRFSKRAITADQFFVAENQQVVNNAVLPFVWKQSVRLLHLLKDHKVAVYDARETWPNLYQDKAVSFAHMPAEVKLEFNRTSEGTKYTLHVEHDDEQIDLHTAGMALIAEEPCFFLHKEKLHHLGEHVSGKLIKPFLTKSVIHIPKHIEHTYFKGFVKKSVNKLNITARGFEIKDLDIHPTAVLSIEMDWRGNHGFVLLFDYDGRRMPVNNRQNSFTFLDIKGDHYVFKRFQRKKEFEKRACELLSNIGLRQDAAFFCFKKGCLQQHTFIRFVNENAGFLKDNGFIIEQPKSECYLIDKPEVILSNHDQTDWFDLKIIIKIQNAKIPFIALKDHILHGEPVYTLPSGEKFLIPEDWFARYKGLMIHGKAQDDTLRIDRRHFRMLEEFAVPEAKKLQTELFSEQTTEKPELMNVELRPYQLTGFAWMQNLVRQAMGGILADDMGLGKTLQVIALLSSYFTKKQQAVHGDRSVKTTTRHSGFQLSLFDDAFQESNASGGRGISGHHLTVGPLKRPALLVVPTSILHNWLHEIKRYTPWLQVHEYVGPHRSLNKQIFENHQVVLTTYGCMRSDIELLKAFSFSHAILDESHLVKNPYSKTARAAFALQADNRFTLTGTPVENCLTDIWSQMHFVNPGMLGSLSGFQRNYASPIEKDPKAFEAAQLLDLLNPFVMRRTKDQVARELPPITETSILCSMSNSQSKLYEREKSRLRNVFLEDLSHHTQTQPKQLLLLRALMRLRQIANHPRMVYGEHDADSGKFDAVTSRLETLVAEKHKVLVFSSFVTHLEIIEAWCKQHGVAHAKLTGSTMKREAVISAFRKKDIPVFLISLKAGGVGLNLPEAGYVFLLDPWWNPAAELQAINRTHRIGQDKNVIVYRFISKDTIEEKIIRLQEKKRSLATAIIRADEFVKSLSPAEMESLLQ